MKEIRIHIGAHKTATTHLQNTLNEMDFELRRLGITYLPLNIVRPRIQKILSQSILYNYLPNFAYRTIINRILFKNSTPPNKAIISEENILGSSVDLLSANPYQNFDRQINFIKILAKNYKVSIFLSIRSFDQVFPGAYITGLKFHPKEAVIAKNKLLSELEKKQYPNWLDLIDRLVALLPNLPIQIWTQEDYKYHSSSIIRQFIGTNLPKIPNLPPPIRTKTPSILAISEVEKKLDSINPSVRKWSLICDEIYTSLPPASDSDKYTFLSQDIITSLKENYQKDLSEIIKKYGKLLDLVKINTNERIN
jgi:hypothetical protein